MASGFYDLTSKTLGKGHYGVVKLGRHCLTGEPVAIKIIEKSKLNHDSLNQLGTEIRILFRLSEYEHPNILKLYQTIDTRDKLFLITEYCGPHACDLHDYLSRKHCRDGLSESEAQVFFIQICSAISYCHSMGIVHRDLKPENILVTDYKHMHAICPIGGLVTSATTQQQATESPSASSCGQLYPILKLIDFGFANQWYPDEKMSTSCGTLAYSAPELLLGESYDGTKVDVWGLGLMLYILLYGGNPFMQINDNETLTKILDCSFSTPKRANVDSNAVELLRSLIKRNPDTRLPMDAILKHKWFASIPKRFETMHKYQNKPEQASAKQLAKITTQVGVHTTLPSISESGPLRNLKTQKSLDDGNNLDLSKETEAETTPKHSYNRSRSLSITRTHAKIPQLSSLPKTRSSISLEGTSQAVRHVVAPQISRASPKYRPTSPDIGGSSLITEEENRIHDRVILEMFDLTKLIDSKSSIEASLKNARFSHRSFNQNSIQPVQFEKRKVSTGVSDSFVKTSGSSLSENAPPSLVESDASKQGAVDKLSLINNKLSNDDYIYATYQLIRDKLLRVKQEKLKRQASKELSDDESLNPIRSDNKSKNETILEEAVIQHEDDVSSAKENEGARLHQRRLLQPQHKMRDKFTSFFRSGSTSPSGSFSTSCDSQQGETLFNLANSTAEAQHEAFNDLNNEIGISNLSRHFANKSDTSDNALAYALPLARKCSLVSEESGCSNELPDQ